MKPSNKNNKHLVYNEQDAQLRKHSIKISSLMCCPLHFIILITFTVYTHHNIFQNRGVIHQTSQSDINIFFLKFNPSVSYLLQCQLGNVQYQYLRGQGLKTTRIGKKVLSQFFTQFSSKQPHFWYARSIWDQKWIPKMGLLT